MINPKKLALAFLAMTAISGVEASNTQSTTFVRKGRR
jgi:hypothetical protein